MMAAMNPSPIPKEDDRTLELGALTLGGSWHRPNDRAGIAFVANGIVAAHQRYLALGGVGFLLGDGGLAYGSERIFEGFLHRPPLARLLRIGRPAACQQSGL